MKPCRIHPFHRAKLLQLLLVMFLLVLFAGQREGLAAPGDIVTVAGGYIGDGGSATAGYLNYPASVTKDIAGNLYVADTSNNRIRKIDGATGIITTVAGIGERGYSGDGGAAISARLNWPKAVSTDASGNLYIADNGNHSVRKVDMATGIITTIAGTGTAGYGGDGGAAVLAPLNSPGGVFADTTRNVIYIADSGNNRIRKIDAFGVITTVVGTGVSGFYGDGGLATTARLNSPNAIATDTVGALYISDTYNYRIRKVNTSGIISTVAGKGGPLSNNPGDGGSAILAELYPMGLSVDTSGSIYVADANYNSVRKITSGIITAIAGNGTVSSSGDGGAATSAGVNQPYGVFADASGYIYIAECSGLRIRKVTVSSGIITTIAGQGSVSGYSGDGGLATSASLYAPYGVAFDSASNMYLADTYNHRIRKIDAGTGVITTIAGSISGFTGDNGSASLARLASPSAIAIDNQNNIYVADTGNNRIRVINNNSGVITTLAGNGLVGYSGDAGAATAASLNHPYGLTVDAWHNVYFADKSNHRIRKVDASSGLISTVAGNGTVGYSGDNGAAINASLNYPDGIALDVHGSLYIADSFNNRIRKVDLATGIITTVAGNGNYGFSGDGQAATSATLNHPAGVLMDVYGNMYIADTANDRIRKVGADTGIITTVAGAGSYEYSGDNGPAASAGLASPRNIMLDSLMNLYIADFANNRIRKVLEESGTAVIGSITINSGSAYTNNTSVTLNLSCVSLSGNCTEMQFSDDSISWSAQEPYATSKNWTVTSGDGIKAVFVKFYNSSATASSAYSASVTLDTTAPTVSISSPTAVNYSINTPLLTYSVSDGTVSVKVDGVVVNKVSGNYLSALANDTHTVQVQATDAAGNAAFAEVTFIVYVPPTVNISYPATGSTNNNSPLLTYTVSSGAVVVKVDGVVVSKVSGDTLGPLADGTHTVRVEATDIGGTGFSETSFTVDTVVPIVSITSPTTGITTDSQPLLTYSVSDGTVTVKVDGVVVSKISGNRLSALANGPHAVRVESRDAAGNIAVAEVSFSVDAPVIANEDFETGDLTRLPWVTSGNGLWSANNTVKHGGSYAAEAPVSIIDSQNAGMEVSMLCASANISFWYSVSSEANYDFLTFYVDGVQKGRWSGTVPWTQATYAVIAGTHTFKWVYSKDGSVSSGSDTAWVDDIVFPVPVAAPTVGISSPAAGVTNNNRPALNYTVSNGTVVVKVDGITVSKVSGNTLDPLSDGVHSVRVEATNSGGTGFAETTFTVDTMAPGLGINVVTSPTNSNNQTITGTRENNAAINISANTAVTVGIVEFPTATTWSCPVSGLVEGGNTFTVTASDAVFNTAVATTTIILDTVPPLVTIAAPMAGVINSRTPVLSYSVSDGTPVVKVDGIVIAKVSGDTLGPLADGLHTIRVDAADAAGNSGFAEVSITVDATAPTVTITSPTAGQSNNRTPLLTFSVSEGTAVVTVDGVMLPLISGDILSQLADGLHNVRIDTIDDAGNHAFAEVSFTIDTTAPAVSITSPANGISNNNSPVLNYTASDGVVVVKVDGLVVNKVSGELLDVLADGFHVVRVESTDNAGNSGFAETSFTIDTVAPVVTITAPVSGPTNNRPALAFTVNDGAVVVKIDGVVVNKVSGETLDQLVDGLHTVRIEATDVAGNIGISEVSFSVESYSVILTAGPNGTISGPALVNYGGSATYSITPATGYHVADVLVDGVSAGAVTSYSFSSVTTNHTISASFAINSYNITATAGANGGISGPASVIYDDSAAYTITPATGYHVVDVLVDGVSVGAVTSYSFSNVTADHTIAASFAINTYSITATAGANGSISGPATVNYGDSASYTITPATGYHVVDVMVDGVSAGAVTSYSFSNVTVAHSISASFVINSYNITTTAGANGSISGPATVNYGDSASYTITPATGYHVADVLVDGASVGAVTSYSFSNATASHSISATFAINTYSVTATAGANGSISGPATVNYGDSASYSITPATGYHVADVLADGVSVGAVTSYTFSNVTAAHTISASFAINGYSITATAGTNGSISGPATVNHGGSAAYSITPATGYHVADVLVDGVSAGAVTSYSFSNVTAAHTISASFAINSYSITVTAGTNGSISGPATVNHGGSAAYSITPATGYHVADVLVDGVSAGAVTSYSFSNVTAAHIISASFAINSYSITVTAGTNGSISGPATVNHGGSAAYTITPVVGYRVADVLVDGVSAGAVTSYTFSNVTAAHTISASFAALADLAINSVTGPSSGTRGKSISVSSSIKNQGGTNAVSFTVSFYLSKDTAVNSGDTLLGTKTVTALNAGSASTVSGNYTVPSGMTTGKYYVGVIVDSGSVVAESNESNNSKAAASTTTVR